MIKIKSRRRGSFEVSCDKKPIASFTTLCDAMRLSLSLQVDSQESCPTMQAARAALNGKPEALRKIWLNDLRFCHNDPHRALVRNILSLCD